MFSVAAQLGKYSAILLAGVALTALTNAPLFGYPEPGPNNAVKYFDDLFSTALTPTAQWVVGSKALLLVSNDGGRRWERKTLHERRGGLLMQDFDLYSIRFTPDGRTGWISGEKGLIFYTSDGGLTWVPRFGPLDQNIFRVVPVDSQRACAVGTESTLLCTTDAGEHWTSHGIGKFIDMNDVTFVGEEGWAVGSYQTILHTNDGGTTWRLQHGGNTKTLAEEAYFSVAFTDSQHGGVAGLAGEIVFTNDGGRTWGQYGGPTRPSLFAVAWAGPSLWLGGKRGTLLAHTPDDHWRDVRISSSDITDIDFAGKTGIAVGLEGMLALTADGGKSWHLVGAE
jgi:photosystem II stability/assembly factor-like uncharacterized protein